MLHVDGGVTASDGTTQLLADMLGVERPRCLETTALGAGHRAGLDAGIYPEPGWLPAALGGGPPLAPRLGVAERARKYAGWQAAVVQMPHRLD